MPICVGMGEGVGAVAAAAVKQGIPYDKVDLARIQSYLKQGD